MWHCIWRERHEVEGVSAACEPARRRTPPRGGHRCARSRRVGVQPHGQEAAWGKRGGPRSRPPAVPGAPCRGEPRAPRGWGPRPPAVPARAVLYCGGGREGGRQGHRACRRLGREGERKWREKQEGAMGQRRRRGSVPEDPAAGGATAFGTGEEGRTGSRRRLGFRRPHADAARRQRRVKPRRRTPAGTSRGVPWPWMATGGAHAPRAGGAAAPPARQEREGRETAKRREERERS